MSEPPGVAPTRDGNLTALRPKKRDRRAEADRYRLARTPVHAKIVRLMRQAGREPEPWQVESLAATFTDLREPPTDEQVLRQLMAAPWFPKRHRRQRLVS